MRNAVIILAIVSALSSLDGLTTANSAPIIQPSTDWQKIYSTVVEIKFECRIINSKLVCGKFKPDKTKKAPVPAPVEQPCPTGMVGKQPNCTCPDGTYLVAFTGCVPVIPTAPPPSTPSDATKKHYCITCGGPGCLQKAPACPSGGLTTCADIPGKTYYNCCCN